MRPTTPTPRSASSTNWAWRSTRPARQPPPSALVRVVRMAVHPVGHAVAVTVAASPAAGPHFPTTVTLDPAVGNPVVAAALAQVVAGHPDMVVVAPFPVARCPYIAVACGRRGFF